MATLAYSARPHNNLRADDLAQRLHARHAGPGKWLAKCPAHDDRRPSLSIREGRDGRILVHCFARCETRDILRALGYDWSALFASENRVHFSHSQRPGPLIVLRDIKREKYEQLRQFYRETATSFRWLTQRVEEGELELISLCCDHERELDDLHRKLCQLAKEGYRALR